MRNLIRFVAILVSMFATIRASGQNLDRPSGVVVAFGWTSFQTGETSKAIGFSPNGRDVVRISTNDIHSWEIATGLTAKRNQSFEFAEQDRLSFSADGKHVVVLETADEKWGTLHVLDTRTGLERHTRKIPGPENITVSDDGDYVAIEDKKACRFERTDGTTAAIAIPKVTNIKRLSASLDGKRFAYCHSGGSVSVRYADLPIWEVTPLKDHRFATVTLNRDGTQLATTCYRDNDENAKPAGPIQIWDVATRKHLRDMSPTTWYLSHPTRVRFTPDGTMVVAGDQHHLRGWTVATGKIAFATENPTWNGNFQISSDSRYVAVDAGRPVVWDLSTGTQPPALLGHTGLVCDIALSPDGMLAATSALGSPDVYIWSTTTGKNVAALRAEFARSPDSQRVDPGRVRHGFSFDNQRLFTMNEASGSAGPLRVWDVKQRQLVWEKAIATRFAPEAAFTKHGLFVGLERIPTLLDVDTGRTIWTKTKQPNAVLPVVSRFGDSLAYEDRSGTLILDPKTGREIDRFPGTPIGFTPDLGTMYHTNNNVVIGRDSIAHLNRPAKIGNIETICHEAGVGANFDPSLSNYRVVDLQTGTDISRCAAGELLKTENDTVLSADGRLLAKLSPTSIIVWETATGDELIRFEHALGEPKIAVFSKDGRTFYTSHGSIVHGWDMTGGYWATRAKPTLDDTAKAKSDFGGKPAVARRAIHLLANDPVVGFAYAKNVTTPATEGDIQRYEKWIANLDAAAFADRDTASRELALAGWRAESMMQRARKETESPEVQQRLETLLAKPDVRAIRAVELLERIGTAEAIARIRELAKLPTGPLAREACRTSARLPAK